MKLDCKNCKSEATCLDEPVEDCKEFRETAEARRNRIEAEVKAHDERVRAEAIDEFAKLLKKKLNQYIDYDDNGEQTFESNPDLVWGTIDEALAECERRMKNEKNNISYYL